MSETLILRFRDLVTESGGTVREHRRILEAQGVVWWGWWMRQSETAPLNLFRRLLDELNGGTEPAAWLFDTGQELLHACRIADLRVAPPGDTIGPPSLDQTPTYYQRGTYPAWFLLSAIDDALEVGLPEGWTYSEFPSNAERREHKDLLGQPVASLEQLRNTDATIWVVGTAAEQ